MEPTELTTLRVDRDERGVATITMDRPAVRNAFDAALIGEMTQVARALGADPDVRAVVLTGAGDVFSAGADLGWMGSMTGWSREENEADARRMDGMFRALWDLPCALIGRIGGHAIAGGTGLVAVCDIAIAVEGARFGLTEVVLGLSPAVVAPYVVRTIGIGHARALFVTGELFDAARAQRIGLVHEVVADAAALDAAVDAATARCLRAGPAAVAVAKTVPELVMSADLDGATARTPAIIAGLRVSEEGQAGMAAFLARRPAPWVPENRPGGNR